MTMNQPIKKLSKSRYMKGMFCPKSLWLQTHMPQTASGPAVSQRMSEQGHHVGYYAQRQFATGILIKDSETPMPDAIEKTRNALIEHRYPLFEAVITTDDKIVLPDILIPNDDDSWNLIEVKSSTKLKPEHLDDIAYQFYVLTQAGIKLDECYLWVINSDCVWPDEQSLFKRINVTREILAKQANIETNSQHLLDYVELKDEPNHARGTYCKKGPCEFLDYCWDGEVGMTIYEIPNISDSKLLLLQQAGIAYISEITNFSEFTALQQQFFEMYNTNGRHIDGAAIADKLAALTYPLYFFDFEAELPAIPLVDGMKPYQKLPFQYSCHILHQDGKLDHQEFLHQDKSDPRRKIAEALINDLGSTGHIIVYNEVFEKGVLQNLSLLFPDLKAALDLIIDRLWDLMEIFKTDYKDFKFGGSYSIKNILPVLVPKLTYDSLEIQKGDQAQLVWQQLINSEDSQEQKLLEAALLAYCKLDTLAMVEIYRRLLERFFQGCIQ